MQSNPTQTLVSTRTTTTSRAERPVSPHFAGVDVSSQNRSRTAFALSLERVSQTEAEGPDAERPDNRTVERDSDRRDNESHNQPQQQEQNSDTVSDMQALGRIQQNFLTPGGISHVALAAPLLSAEQLANLQRMAAAIAEVAKNGIDARMTVEFGQTGGVANAAILGRDSSGGLTIHLTGAIALASQTQLQSMRAELMNRLNRRKIAVSSIEFLDARPVNDAEPHEHAKRRHAPDRT